MPLIFLFIYISHSGHSLGLPLYHLEAKLLPAIIEEPHLDPDLVLLLSRDLALSDKVVALFDHIANAVLVFCQF